MFKKSIPFCQYVLLTAFCLLIILAITGCASPTATSPKAKDYYRIVLLADPHLPGRNLALKEDAVNTLNSWDDVDLVVVLGDICNDRGTAEEYAFAQNFLNRLTKPVAVIAGNHDYIYEDEISPVQGRRIKGPPQTRAAKLQRFKDTFGLAEIYYTRRAGPYLLIFLSPDDLSSPNLTQISGQQLKWLRTELARNSSTPAIVLFHGPLDHTFSGKNETVGSNLFIAQPAAEIDRIIKDNPQLFLWISGHIHIAPGHASFNSATSIYAGQVTNIHNPDMNGSSYLSENDRKTTRHEGLWSNSLYLYPDKVLVRTFDHRQKTWLTNLDRVIRRPQ